MHMGAWAKGQTLIALIALFSSLQNPEYNHMLHLGRRVSLSHLIWKTSSTLSFLTFLKNRGHDF